MIVFYRNGKGHQVNSALGERLDGAALVGQKAPAFNLPQVGRSELFTLTKDSVVVIDF